MAVTSKEIAQAVQTTLSLDSEPNATDIAAGIWNSASPSFREVVPSPYEVNSLEFGQGILSDPDLTLEFVKLIGRIARVIALNVSVTNNLAQFKTGTMEYGEAIEEYAVEVAEAATYNMDVAEVELFKRKFPKMENVFYKVNSERMYKTTIAKDQLKKAFTSYEGITGIVAKIVNSLSNGDAKDEYNFMKSALVSHYESGKMKNVAVTAVTDTATAKALAKLITEYAALLTEPTNEYNSMHITRQDNMQDLYLFVNAKVMANLNIEWLAQTFQLDKAEFKLHVKMIPTLPTGTNGTLQAVLCSGDIWRVFDKLYDMESVYNQQGLYFNYFLHHWQAICTNPFANAIAFVSGGSAAAATGVTFGNQTITVNKGDVVETEIYVNTSGIGAPVALTASSDKANVTASISADLDKITVSIGDSAASGLATITVTETNSSKTGKLYIVVQ